MSGQIRIDEPTIYIHPYYLHKSRYIIKINICPLTSMYSAKVKHKHQIDCRKKNLLTFSTEILASSNLLLRVGSTLGTLTSSTTGGLITRGVRCSFLSIVLSSYISWHCLPKGSWKTSSTCT